MKFDFDNAIPIYIQLVEYLKINIIAGILKPGERLLSVRELALQAKVNPNTVQKALLELESLEFIYTERTNGKFVTKNRKLIEKYKKEYAFEISNVYLNNMYNIGFSKEEILEHLKELGG